jgi:hypothetical protein
MQESQTNSANQTVEAAVRVTATPAALIPSKATRICGVGLEGINLFLPLPGSLCPVDSNELSRAVSVVG